MNKMFCVLKKNPFFFLTILQRLKRKGTLNCLECNNLPVFYPFFLYSDQMLYCMTSSEMHHCSSNVNIHTFYTRAF